MCHPWHPCLLWCLSMRPRHGEWGFGLAVAITLVVAAPAAATSWIVPDPESMADSADAVVLATVKTDS